MASKLYYVKIYVTVFKKKKKNDGNGKKMIF